MAPQQRFQADACRTVPVEGAFQFDRRVADLAQRLRVAIFAVPRDPQIYGAGVNDYYVRCLVQGCGAWSSPFTWKPRGADLLCRSCAERKAGAENFKVLLASSRWGCFQVEEIELDEPVVRAVVAGV